jgi:hypothetical protein
MVIKMMDIDYILNGKSRGRKLAKKPLDLFGSIKGIGAVGDIVTPKQKRFLKKTKIGTGKSHKRFWDIDGDGVISGLDCAPKNQKKHMAWRKPEPYEYVEEMSPSRYLNLTKTSESEPFLNRYYDDETQKMESIEQLSAHITSKDKIVNIPFVNPTTGDHEGRHRAFAAKLAGQEKIKVKVPPPASWRTDDVANKFIEKAFANSREDRKNEWRRRLQEEEFPSNYIYDDVKEAYTESLREAGAIEKPLVAPQTVWHAGDRPPSETLKEKGRVYGFSDKRFAEGWKKAHNKKDVYQYTTDDYLMDDKNYARPVEKGKERSDNEYISFDVKDEKKIEKGGE